MEKLGEKEWDDFELDQLADVYSGQDMYAQERVPGKTPYITSGSKNNGIGYFVGNDNGSKAVNSISVNRNGAVGEAFYHPYAALYSNDCRRIELRNNMEPCTQLFIAKCISLQKKIFSYSRKLGTARLKRLHFMLPVNAAGNPDYGYMLQYISLLRERMLRKYKAFLKGRISKLKHKDIPKLTDMNWRPIKISDISNVYSGHDIYARERIPGNIPLVTAVGENNGIGYFVGNNNDSFSKGTISVVRNGASVGQAFYHKYMALFGNDCRRIKLKDSNSEFVSLFITPRMICI